MARIEDEFLDEDTVVAEAVEPLTLDALEAFADVLLVIGEAHALAAAAGAGLHHHRIADFVRNLDGVFGVADFADKAGDDVDARFLRELLRLDLVAHRGDRVHRRADEGDIFLGERLGKAGALGQEAIARMHSLGARRLARGDDLVGDQIGFGRRRRPDMHRLVGHLHERRARVGVRIDGDGSNAHAARGLDDAAGDFAAVGD